MQADATETLARYIYSKNHYKASDRTVKYAAFVPQKDNNRLSVFRISGLEENEIWKIAKDLRAQPLLARADIQATSVFEASLAIERDDTPPGHANIVGWPEKDAEIKLKAVTLAEKANLLMR